jgi:hypothetical protein
MATIATVELVSLKASLLILAVANDEREWELFVSLLCSEVQGRAERMFCIWLSHSTDSEIIGTLPLLPMPVPSAAATLV